MAAGLNEHVRENFPKYFPGLLVLWLGSAGKKDEAREAATWSQADITDAFQWALTYVGLGDPEQAICWLRDSVEERHPLTLWLHLWPVFDSLRRRKHFKALMQQVGVQSWFEAAPPAPED